MIFFRNMTVFYRNTRNVRNSSMENPVTHLLRLCVTSVTCQSKCDPLVTQVTHSLRHESFLNDRLFSIERNPYLLPMLRQLRKKLMRAKNLAIGS